MIDLLMMVRIDVRVPIVGPNIKGGGTSSSSTAAHSNVLVGRYAASSSSHHRRVLGRSVRVTSLLLMGMHGRTHLPSHLLPHLRVLERLLLLLLLTLMLLESLVLVSLEIITVYMVLLGVMLI